LNVLNSLKYVNVFYNVASMKQLFDEVEPNKIFSFLKEIGLFYRL